MCMQLHCQSPACMLVIVYTSMHYCCMQSVLLHAGTCVESIVHCVNISHVTRAVLCWISAPAKDGCQSQHSACDTFQFQLTEQTICQHDVLGTRMVSWQQSWTFQFQVKGWLGHFSTTQWAASGQLWTVIQVQWSSKLEEACLWQFSCCLNHVHGRRAIS